MHATATRAASAKEPGCVAGLEQVRRIVGELDCSCRGKLDEALDRFAALQTAR